MANALQLRNEKHGALIWRGRYLSILIRKPGPPSFLKLFINSSDRYINHIYINPRIWQVINWPKPTNCRYMWCIVRYSQKIHIESLQLLGFCQGSLDEPSGEQAPGKGRTGDGFWRPLSWNRSNLRWIPIVIKTILYGYILYNYI